MFLLLYLTYESVTVPLNQSWHQQLTYYGEEKTKIYHY